MHAHRRALPMLITKYTGNLRCSIRCRPATKPHIPSNPRNSWHYSLDIPKEARTKARTHRHAGVAAVGAGLGEAGLVLLQRGRVPGHGAPLAGAVLEAPRPRPRAAAAGGRAGRPRRPGRELALGVVVHVAVAAQPAATSASRHGNAVSMRLTRGRATRADPQQRRIPYILLHVRYAFVGGSNASPPLSRTFYLISYVNLFFQ